MKLYEDEAKQLLSEVEISASKGISIDTTTDLDALELSFPAVAKAQVLSGSRGKRGLVKLVDSHSALKLFYQQSLGKLIDGEVVSRIRVEPRVAILCELYLCFTYSTLNRGPVLLCGVGGMEVETEGSISEQSLAFGTDLPSISLPPLPQLSPELRISLEAKLYRYATKLWQLFEQRDLFLLEINPLAITTDHELMALDAKIVTDEAAHPRQDWQYPERNILGRPKTPAEMQAEAIDKDDHRGVVGRVYLDLDGDIGIITAGGGASMVAMDALVASGLRPANYTEFSGNPPRDKVKTLTQIVLSKPGLKGAILVGGKANFTDQVETLSGFLDGLLEVRPRFPIVVRRDGPNMAQAKQLLETTALKAKLDLEVYDASMPIVDAVNRLASKVGK